MSIKNANIEYVPLWKKTGAALVTAALVVSMVPLTALAEGSNSGSSSSANSSSSASNSADSANSSQQGQQQNQQGQQPPQGNGSGDSASDGGAPPEKPDGDTSGPGENDGTPPSDGNGGTPPDGQGGGANTQSFDFSGSYSATKAADGEEVESTGETIESSESDQNAALAQNGGTLIITDGSISKSGDSADNGDNCNFYGTNSGVLAVGESSKAVVTDTTLETSSAGSNGIFATDGATVFANNTSITTTSESGNARGLDATYGGTIIANKMSVSTKGEHCAAVATDRGGGNVSVANSTLKTAGSGSPLLYSTGDIEVENVEGVASKSQIAGMEGKNSILISNSTLESTNTGTTGSDPIANGVIIYQSTSGDADTSTGDAANFTATNSTLTSAIESGSMFYLTNTTANVVLSSTTLDFDSSKANLLQAEGNDSNNWGNAGSNGATVNFTMVDQEADGNITADDISTASVFLLEGSTWTGAASVTENSASDKTTSDAPLSINVSADSTWTVSGDSTVTNLNVAEGGKVVDADGKTVTVLDSDGNKLVEGDSVVSVTVTGSYGTSVSVSEANDAATASIDRADFDEYYSTQTTFGNNSADADRGADNAASVQNTEALEQNPVLEVFNSIVKFFSGLFGGGSQTA